MVSDNLLLGYWLVSCYGMVCYVTTRTRRGRKGNVPYPPGPDHHSWARSARRRSARGRCAFRAAAAHSVSAQPPRLCADSPAPSPARPAPPRAPDHQGPYY